MPITNLQCRADGNWILRIPGAPTLVLGLLPLLLLSTSCSQQPGPDAAASAGLARVGNAVIPEETFRRELERRARLEPGRYATLDARRGLLDELVRFEAMHQKALAAGYAERDDVRQKMKRLVVARYEEDQLAASNPATVEGHEIEAYYRQHGDVYGKPARARIAVVRISCPRTAPAEQRAKLRAQAELARAEAATNLTAGSTLGAVARKYSDHQGSRYRGGDIGWLKLDAPVPGWPDEMISIVGSLTEPGALSPVVSAPDGFYVVKVIEREAAGRRPLEQVRPGIEHKLLRDREQARTEVVHAAAVQGLEVRINESKLAAITLPASSEKAPPSMAGRPLAKATNP